MDGYGYGWMDMDGHRWVVIIIYTNSVTFVGRTGYERPYAELMREGPCEASW